LNTSSASGLRLQADAMSDFDVIGEFEKQATSRQQEQNEMLRQQL
jgi:hypothetical protein